MISSVCICCSGLIKSALVFLVVDPSILCREGGVGFFLTWRKKSLRSFSERKGGGMGPIHAEHYHFDCFDAVFRGGGEGRERESSPESAATQPGMFNRCFNDDSPSDINGIHDL